MDTAFAVALRDTRRRLRVSQSRLAEAAGFDHSYMSRLEAGVRQPRRDTVRRLADAMRLSSDDEDRLLMAAGYMPDGWDDTIDPLALRLAEVLGDDDIPASTRAIVRCLVDAALRLDLLASGREAGR